MPTFQILAKSLCTNDYHVANHKKCKFTNLQSTLSFLSFQVMIVCWNIREQNTVDCIYP